jgi:hypothetical protein
MVTSTTFVPQQKGLVVVNTGQILIGVTMKSTLSTYARGYFTVSSLSFPTGSGASPVLRCHYLSCTSAVDSYSCIPTVRSFTRDNNTFTIFFNFMVPFKTGPKPVKLITTQL